MPNSDSGESLINLNSSNLNTDFQITHDVLISELTAMLWPYYLDNNFIIENLKLNSLPALTESQKFTSLISSHLLTAYSINRQTKKLSTTSLRISLVNFLNKTTLATLNSLGLGKTLISYYLNDKQRVFSTDIAISNEQNTSHQKVIQKNSVLNHLINSFVGDDNESSNQQSDSSRGLNNMTIDTQKAIFSKNHENFNENKVYLSINSCYRCVSFFCFKFYFLKYIRYLTFFYFLGLMVHSFILEIHFYDQHHVIQT